MSQSPFVRGIGTERRSDAPLALDSRAVATRRPVEWLRRASHSLLGLSVCVAAGVLLLIVVALGIFRGDGPPRIGDAGVVTDNVVHLHARDIGASCWRGAPAKNGGPARISVSLEIGLDGKIRNAIAAGVSPAMRGCVEAHVKSWEFLPQAVASQMVLPFEIDR